MKRTDEYQSMHAFVDGELDLASRLEMEERIRVDAPLAQKVQELGQLRATIREGADYHAAPDSLRRRTARPIAPELPSPVRSPSAVVADVQRWLDWRPLVASLALAAMAAVALNLIWLSSAHKERLLDDVVGSHVRSTLGQHLVDITSSDHHAVKPWLSSKLDFSPPVSELQIPGSSFLGGRVDYLDGHPVAALVYRQGEHVVNSFIWPGNGKNSKPEFLQVRGFQTANWVSNGMTHWVVSDVDPREFDVVVGAIRSADTQR